MRSSTSLAAAKGLAVVLACLAPAGSLGAEDEPAAAVESTPGVESTLDAEPAPGDEVMTPTERGLRITPALARALGRYWVHGQFDGLTLTRDQSERLSALAAERILNHPLAGGDGGANFVEYMLEAEMAVDPKFTPESGRRFAERHALLSPQMFEFEDEFARRARPLLEPGQQEALDKWIRQHRRWSNRFQAKLKRWAESKAEDGEAPFDWKESDLAADPEEPDNRSEQVRHAEQWAHWGLRRLGPPAWLTFAHCAEDFFRFDAGQKARASELLADYRRRADAVMTHEWSEKVQANRLRLNLTYMIGDQPLWPWQYHLETEFQEAARPVLDLGRSFRDAVLGLVTDEQRERAMADLRVLGESYKLPPEMLDRIRGKLVVLAREHAASREANE